MVLGQGDSPRVIEAALESPAGPDHILPAGAARYKKPLTDHDYIIAHPADQAAVDAVLHKVVMEMRRAMKPYARLYVVIGEWHAMPAHHMAQAGLLDNLAAAAKAGSENHGALLYAHEAPYDDLPYYIRHHCDVPVSESVRPHLHEHDPQGRYFAQAAMAFDPSSYAPQSLKRIFSRCLQHKISLVPYDAGRDESYKRLALTDDLTRAFIDSQHKGRSPGPRALSVEGKSGMTIRNAVMAERIAMAADRHQAGTIIVGVGAEHLGGRARGDRGYKNSLTACLKQKIRPQDRVLPVFFSARKDRDYKAERYTPAAFWQDNPGALIIRGAGEEHYYNGSPAGAEDHYIARLGCSYGANIPERFNVLTAPGPEEVRAMLRVFVDIATFPPEEACAVSLA